MGKHHTRSNTTRSTIAAMRRGIFDMEKLRDKLIPIDQVAPDMIHFDASIAMAKVLLSKLELEKLEDVSFKDTLEMRSFLSTEIYTEEEIRRFYSLEKPHETVEYYYSTVYCIPEMVAAAKKEENGNER